MLPQVRREKQEGQEAGEDLEVKILEAKQLVLDGQSPGP